MESLSDPFTISKPGMKIRPVPHPPARLEVPTGAKCGFDTRAGRWLAQWQSVAGATAYEARMTPDLTDPGRWLPAGTVSAPRVSVASPGGWWFSVRAVNASGVGPWSDPVPMRHKHRSKKAA